MLDRAGAQLILQHFMPYLPRLRLIWADGGYESADWISSMQSQYQVEIEVRKRPADQTGFVVIPRRWVVERSIAWLGRSRRLSKDYEYSLACSAGFVYLASIRRLLKHITNS